ncbi:MAG: SDR family oxidoreductase [Nocardioides sp.]
MGLVPHERSTGRGPWNSADPGGEPTRTHPEGHPRPARSPRLGRCASSSSAPTDSSGPRSCGALLAAGHEVRGTVRAVDRGAALAGAGVEVVEADLTTARGWPEALDDVEAVLLTANAVAPRRGDNPVEVDAGCQRLVDDATRAGVRRFVLVSVPETAVDAKVPAMRERRALEQHVIHSGVPYSIVRFPPFMETWLALVGSSLPLRGEPHATIGRPSPFLRQYRRGTGTLVERRGLMRVPGPASHEHAFISVGDVATACAAAVDAPDVLNRVVEVGGPEVLTWADVAEVFGRVLGRKVRIVSTPGAGFAALSSLAAPVAKVPSATFSLNRYVASSRTPWPPGGAGLVDPAGMVTVEQFLAAKAELPSQLPSVS